MLSPQHIQSLQPHIARSGVGLQALAANPWQFVPVATAKLREASLSDPLRNEIRIALAFSLARLGLRTLALESLANTFHPATPPLRDCIEAFPNDHIDVRTRIATCRGNIDAMHTPLANEPLRAFQDWSANLNTARLFRTASNSRVLFRSDNTWQLLLDDATIASVLESGSPHDGPFYCDGFHVPLTIERLFKVTRRPQGQVQARIILLAGSIEETLTCLSLYDLREVLSAPTVEVWQGVDCPQRVHQHALSRVECTLGWTIASPQPLCELNRWPKGDVTRALTSVGEVQQSQLSASKSRLESLAHTASKDHLDRIQRWPNTPLRILIPTTRYSTYIQHASRDLANAFNNIGCQTHIQIEPDDSSIATSLALSNAIDTVRPDLILCINTLRSQFKDSIPPHIPFITWVQDAMRHLFDEQSGDALGDLDFVVGHLHREMFDQFRFPRERTLSSHTLASTTKFHAAPIHASLRDKFACDVAYVSHQSETPVAFAQRALAASEPEGLVTRLMPQLLPKVKEVIEQSTIHTPPLQQALEQLTRRTLESVLNAPAPPKTYAEVLYQFTCPLAERTLRQQMISWAAELCDKRNWHLHLYGKGWEQNKAFKQYAKGELNHGEDLRAAYQAARLHLHAGLGGVYHQRVMECALAGGCTLVRIKSDDIWHLAWWAQNELTRDRPDAHYREVTIRGDKYLLTPIADHWQSMLVNDLCTRLNMPAQHDHAGWQVVSHEQLHTALERTHVPLEEAWLTGDPQTSCFWSQESFEQAATAMIQQSGRRTSLANWQRTATQQHYTFEGFAHKVLALVASTLSQSLTPALTPQAYQHATNISE